MTIVRNDHAETSDTVDPGRAGGRTPASGPVGAATDASLLICIAAGDRDALRELYDRLARPVHSLARCLCDVRAAEDVTHEVFLEVWRRADQFDPARGSVRTWLLIMAHRKAVDAVRHDVVNRRRDRPVDDDGPEPPAVPGAGSGALSPIVAPHVRDAVAALPPDHQRTVALAYFGGHTQAEIAAIIGIPLAAVRAQLAAAVALLGERRTSSP